MREPYPSRREQEHLDALAEFIRDQGIEPHECQALRLRGAESCVKTLAIFEEWLFLRMHDMSLTLPAPPSANRMYVDVRGRSGSRPRGTRRGGSLRRIRCERTTGSCRGRLHCGLN